MNFLKKDFIKCLLCDTYLKSTIDLGSESAYYECDCKIGIKSNILINNLNEYIHYEFTFIKDHNLFCLEGNKPSNYTSLNKIKKSDHGNYYNRIQIVLLKFTNLQEHKIESIISRITNLLIFS